MSDELHQLRIQHAALGEQIASAQTEAKAGAIAKVKAIMAEHVLTVADVSDKPSAAKASGKKTGPAPVKYLNASTGATWSGRGMRPNWMKAAEANGATAEQFRIAA